MQFIAASILALATLAIAAPLDNRSQDARVAREVAKDDVIVYPGGIPGYGVVTPGGLVTSGIANGIASAFGGFAGGVAQVAGGFADGAALASGAF